jgi:flagellar biogenesis protein FliO
MVLNVLLFISPQRTINAVKNPLVSLFGAIAFIVLAVWGVQEAMHLLFIH